MSNKTLLENLCERHIVSAAIWLFKSFDPLQWLLFIHSPGRRWKSYSENRTVSSEGRICLFRQLPDPSAQMGNRSGWPTYREPEAGNAKWWLRCGMLQPVLSAHAGMGLVDISHTGSVGHGTLVGFRTKSRGRICKHVCELLFFLAFKRSLSYKANVSIIYRKISLHIYVNKLKTIRGGAKFDEVLAMWTMCIFCVLNKQNV